ncbi:FliH/SctL family protein [Granulicella cerasi]|uniref:Flagellar assembly protein FliH n=1 Tax=Granulicella cerasi TaxID=741063 RepID=A0ABW1Z4G9_9BACT|nr:FliH/SctL family protein [Granulicella cerasi]
MTSLFEQEPESTVVPLMFAEVEETASSEASMDSEEEELRPSAEERHREELIHAVAAAKVQARLDLREELDQRLRDAVETERSAITLLCTSFGKERSRYFAEVETEVVKLALAIAERVLQREVAIDQTMLRGVVHAALSKLSSSEGVRLLVPAADVTLWTRAMKSSEVSVQGASDLHAGDLRLEMKAGAVELGVRAQLVELERGFFDLMAKRPA